jgi:hypothetical protein
MAIAISRGMRALGTEVIEVIRLSSARFAVCFAPMPWFVNQKTMNARETRGIDPDHSIRDKYDCESPKTFACGGGPGELISIKHA